MKLNVDERLTNTLELADLQKIASAKNIIIAGFGGSYAYGTNTPTSDIDIRGTYMNPVEEILGISSDSEQIIGETTDLTLYSFKKMLELWTKCNPNTIELLGLRDKEIIMLSEAGKLLLENKQVFLSKKAIYTFGNYARSQLNRLINKSGRSKSENLNNELRSLDKVIASFEGRYAGYKGGGIKVYKVNDELKLNIHLDNINFHTAGCLLSELNNVERDYSKSSRNDKAIEHQKLDKHMMHLLRLYMMGIDILEKQEIITYREEEHDLLMSIRRGEFLEPDKKTPTKEFERLLAEYQTKFERAITNTMLPDNINQHEVNKLAEKIYRMYI